MRSKSIKGAKAHLKGPEILRIRRAFYALCTQIDHQLRVVIGTLREEGLLDNTIICFTADHGDMLGNHGLWAKRLYYEQSANVPMILLGGRDGRVPHRTVDDRLVGWQDVMPTLLDLAGIDIPDTVEGLSMVGEERRSSLYGECGEGTNATRMIHAGRHKLIYYPVGNRVQLFDIASDPSELNDLAGSPDHAAIQASSASDSSANSTATTKPGSKTVNSSACPTSNGHPVPTAASPVNAASTIPCRPRSVPTKSWGRRETSQLPLHPVRPTPSARQRLLRQSTGADAPPRRFSCTRHPLSKRLHQLPDLRPRPRLAGHRPLRASDRLLGQRASLRWHARLLASSPARTGLLLRLNRQAAL